MKNIKIPQRVGNRLAKHAYLELIRDSIQNVTKSIYLDLDGYENDNDRVKFVYGGKRCTLYGVYLPNTEIVSAEDILSLCLLVNNNGRKERWDVPIPLRDLRFKTLDRIAYEIYDYCKGGADDSEYEDARKEYIAGEMDNYREFMS